MNGSGSAAPDVKGELWYAIYVSRADPMSDEIIGEQEAAAQRHWCKIYVSVLVFYK